jgi:hypothetical protein
MTNTIHLFTAYTPVWILIVAGLLVLAGILLKTETYLRIAFWLVWLGVAASLFTGAMGGASMAKTMLQDGINNASLHTHAWTSAVSILFFILSAMLFQLRRKHLRLSRPVGRLNVYLLLSLTGIALFLFWTIRVAHQIRL